MINISEKERDKLEKLRLQLRRHRGAMKEVAERVGLDRSQVWKVLKGIHLNPEVCKVASAVLVEREQRFVEARRAVDRALGTVEALRPQNVIATTAVAS